MIDYLWEKWSPGLDTPPAHYDEVRRLYSDPIYVRAALRIYRAAFAEEFTDPSLAHWRDYTEAPSSKPLMLIGGAQDGCIDPAHLRASRHVLSEGSRVEILADAGHFAHLEQPETVSSLVLTWLHN